MAESLYFICYSSRDGGDVALNWPTCLLRGRRVSPFGSISQDNLGSTAISKSFRVKDCQGVLYLMTKDSVDSNCPCTQEWIRGVK